MVIQILAALLLVLGSGLIVRALVELDRTPPRRTTRPAEPSEERAGQLPRAA